MLLVLASDLHLGRASSRLPNEASPRDHSAAAAWLRLCNLAVERRAAAVLIAGDVFDQSNRYFEAVHAWEQGLTRLAAAGIPCLAVSGNHDHALLPAWLDQARDRFPRFHLLGADASWSHHDLPGLRVIGWSFPRGTDRVRNAALDSLPPDFLRHPEPVVGLLHADLDATADSPYHPVAVRDLRAVSVQLWVTGHLHIPHAHTGGPGAPVVNPGTPQALDPGETGVHGAWLAHRQGNLWRPDPEPAPLSSIRYETTSWPLADADDPATEEDARALLGRLFQADATRFGAPGRRLVLRPRLTGRSRWPAARWSDWMQELANQTGGNDRLDPLPPELSPALPSDLDEFASQHQGDALGTALRLLQELEREQEPADGVAALVAAAHQRMLDVRRSINPGPPPGEQPPAPPEPSLDDARRLLRAEVAEIVTELLAQTHQP